MKGAKISFDVEGNQLKELTFEGYWHCDGKLELTTIGPEENFEIKDNKTGGIIIEPKHGAAPFRYKLHGSFDEDKAEGTLRITNIPAGCDTYKLNWTAQKEWSIIIAGTFKFFALKTSPPLQHYEHISQF